MAGTWDRLNLLEQMKNEETNKVQQSVVNAPTEFEKQIMTLPNAKNFMAIPEVAEYLKQKEAEAQEFFLKQEMTIIKETKQLYDAWFIKMTGETPKAPEINNNQIIDDLNKKIANMASQIELLVKNQNNNHSYKK